MFNSSYCNISLHLLFEGKKCFITLKHFKNVHVFDCSLALLGQGFLPFSDTLWLTTKVVNPVFFVKLKCPVWDDFCIF